jgi:hypothetical protein
MLPAVTPTLYARLNPSVALILLTFTVKVAELPLQISAEPVMVASGNGFTVTVAISAGPERVALQPVPLVSMILSKVTVWVVAKVVLVVIVADVTVVNALTDKPVVVPSV